MEHSPSHAPEQIPYLADLMSDGVLSDLLQSI